MNLKISVVIPIFNEEGNIISLIDELVSIVDKIGGEIIIVDDHSNDSSANLVLKKKSSENVKIILTIIKYIKKIGHTY